MGGNHSFLLLILLSLTSWVTCNASYDGFARCMAGNNSNGFLFSPEEANYGWFYENSIQNYRKFVPQTAKPAYIFVPETELEIQAALLCAKENGLQIRVKSNGHDYESLSLQAQEPFIVINLFNRRSININLETETAWVETGATLGELYYAISQRSNVLGFNGGACPSVGTGGHISGGGWGWLVRKYGLAADSVLDARLIDVNGNILTRQTMGEDLFWAIRGSGGASYGIITAWKLKLGRVPPVLTVVKVVAENLTAVDQFYRWQTLAPILPKDLFISAFTKTSNNTDSFRAIFKLQYLGDASSLVPILDKEFPELGFKKEHCLKYNETEEFEKKFTTVGASNISCKETTWVDSVYINSGYSGPVQPALQNRKDNPKSYKSKSDYITTPLTKEAIIESWEKYLRVKEPDVDRILVMYLLGGRMDELPSDALPFPFRKGYLYGVEYMVKWNTDEKNQTAIDNRLQWIEDLYEYMAPYASQNPRSAYINYKDLNIGQNNVDGETSYEEAKVWGEKYFRGNFERLAKIKSIVDPENYFRNEQSVVPFQ